MIGIYSMINDSLLVTLTDINLEDAEMWINCLAENLDIYAKEITDH